MPHRAASARVQIFSGVPALSRGNKSSEHANAFSNVLETMSPTITLAFSKPTIFGHVAPVSLRYRSEVERFHTTSGFTNRVRACARAMSIRLLATEDVRVCIAPCLGARAGARGGGQHH